MEKLPIQIAKIDVTKIDKDKLFQGKKGTYLDVVIIHTPDNEYNDFMLVQGLSKEDREAGVQGEKLGNGKFVNSDKGKDNNNGGGNSAPANQDDDDDVPF